MSTATIMRGSHNFVRKMEEMKPSKSDINWVIMDYLVTEGYPGAAEKFAQETNLCKPSDVENIRERVVIKNAVLGGKLNEAIEKINSIDAQLLDNNPTLHFRLLQLQLIEIIRPVLDQPSIQTNDFKSAIKFATEKLSPRAPTEPAYKVALERTMSLMVFPMDKMPTEIKDLLEYRLREQVASDVNKAILDSRGERPEAKIRQLVRARAWAEAQARDARLEPLPEKIFILDGLGPQANGDAMES